MKEDVASEKVVEQEVVNKEVAKEEQLRRKIFTGKRCCGRVIIDNS